jgi:hypothetical protein
MPPQYKDHVNQEIVELSHDFSHAQAAPKTKSANPTRKKSA